METNYLHRILKDYFEEITKVEGFLLSIDQFIKYSVLKLSDLHHDTDSIASLISGYRDLSAFGNGPNLYFSGFRYDLKISNFEEDVGLIVSRECCLTLSQVYEIFESFLKNIFGPFLYNNSTFFEIVNFKGLVKPTTIEEYKDFSNLTQKQEKNNKKLLWSIRKISSFYRIHETKNIWGFNMANWYDLISEIRHAIIHNRQDLTNKVREAINKNQNRVLFERYFISEKSFNTGTIYTDRVKTGELILLFNQFAHLIFKSLSSEVNMDTTYYE